MTEPVPRMRFGVHSGQQYESYDEMLRLWQCAEELGYDWCSVFDHLRPPMGGPAGPCFEGTTLLSALAASTRRIRCALMVAPVAWRHPAVLAALAATIDHVSDGRVELGIGVGGADLAHTQYGLPRPSRAERSGMLEETAAVLRGLWSGGPVSFAGRHYRLDDAHLRPAPVQARLPLVVGGVSDPVLRTAARYGDVWNSLLAEPDRYRARSARLDRACEEAGRDPARVRRSMTFRALLVEDRAELPRELDRLRRRYPPDSPVWPEYLVFGTPAQCAEALWPYRELGVTDFVLGVRPPVDWRSVTLFADQVVPLLRGRRAAA
ncbi:LLM class flavin-dependent oxidoreductase [Amycolatopsis jiangsuensis]|uniref:Alkanesulfonate monooxygenase SsuD/methylene tetrahydromethanopterin reductase-like flavin-dependent oxidoreductase (Luciferase family) n=1 Tax=Amycolatopsis jiangsuensis TaxID=1181879 RepID=A0A840J4L3_9PSEU|nr:LLM class flavin-dependent oxidoreductase [Amycolatopsis jiangsuensis]MBB4688783.1 alkanesulfonate monooxygenase SsuD/methylene tetrahydromethanopterin reductase-like flavin-dependent oxidoreductase (luciferase family) [Amycolatopsis jiangsuensis]